MQDMEEIVTQLVSCYRNFNKQSFLNRGFIFFDYA